MPEEYEDRVGKWTYMPGPETERWGDYPVFDTETEAITAGLRESTAEGYKEYYVGQVQPARIDTSFDGDEIIENKAEYMDEEYGDMHGGEWMTSITQENMTLLESMLKMAFEEWIEITNCYPKTHTIENVSHHKVLKQKDGVHDETRRY